MVEFRGAWTPAEVSDFLQTVGVPIRIATQRPDGSLWPVTVWYRYRDGVFECATHARSDLVSILRNDPGVGIDVSTNDIPYRGVRATGTATVSAEHGMEVLDDLIHRYLGGTDSELARRLLDNDRDEVVIRIEPTELFSWDYSERMRDVQ